MSYANVVATLAMVFAMSGGALAASKFLITSTKQIKPSVLAQLKGKAGVNGGAGAAGPAGPAGPQGSAGANGKDGAAGSAGAQGPAGPTGPVGAKGATGATGQTGFTEKLPSGKTETGTWAVNVFQPTTEKVVLAPIGFAIPVSSGGEGIMLNAAETVSEAGTGGCTGSIEEPTAPKGKLCVYTAEEENEKLSFPPEVFAEETPGHFGKPGGYIEFVVKGGGQASAHGVWAVTAQ